MMKTNLPTLPDPKAIQHILTKQYNLQLIEELNDNNIDTKIYGNGEVRVSIQTVNENTLLAIHTIIFNRLTYQLPYQEYVETGITHTPIKESIIIREVKEDSVEYIYFNNDPTPIRNTFLYDDDKFIIQHSDSQGNYWDDEMSSEPIIKSPSDHIFNIIKDCVEEKIPYTPYHLSEEESSQAMIMQWNDKRILLERTNPGLSTLFD